MTEKQVKEIENFIATHIGINNPYAEILKETAIKFKEFYETAKNVSAELRPFATLLFGLIMKQ